MIRRALSSILPSRLKARLKDMANIPHTRLHPDWQALAPIGPVDKPHVLIDVGSHHGWFFHCWHDWCPQVCIHAFEPREEAASKSLNLYGASHDLTVNQVAVGSCQGSHELKIMEESLVSSSLLDHNRETWEQVQFTTGNISRRMVPVITIDDYCNDREIDSIYLMKVDVQGFEMEVLEGASLSLPGIDHIFIESSIQPLYENAPDFTDVYNFLTKRGFHLMGMRTWHRGNNVLMETDMLFRRNDLAPPVDESIDRITSSI
jgi:FkbM family methyltransferase